MLYQIYPRSFLDSNADGIGDLPGLTSKWDSSPNAGFCPPGVRPWLPVASDYQTYNVAVEQDDPRSYLTLVHTLLTLRRALPALTVGSQQSLDQPNPTCFVYLRQHSDQ